MIIRKFIIITLILSLLFHLSIQYACISLTYHDYEFSFDGLKITYATLDGDNCIGDLMPSMCTQSMYTHTYHVRWFWLGFKPWTSRHLLHAEEPRNGLSKRHGAETWPLQAEKCGLNMSLSSTNIEISFLKASPRVHALYGESGEVQKDSLPSPSYQLTVRIPYLLDAVLPKSKGLEGKRRKTFSDYFEGFETCSLIYYPG